MAPPRAGMSMATAPRPEHVCPENAPLVIDALEFNAGCASTPTTNSILPECEVAVRPIGLQLRRVPTLAARRRRLLHLYRAYRAIAPAWRWRICSNRGRAGPARVPLAQRYLECSLAALAQLARAAAPGRQDQGAALNAARPCDCP
jgi:hypothetical protein